MFVYLLRSLISPYNSFVCDRQQLNGVIVSYVDFFQVFSIGFLNDYFINANGFHTLKDWIFVLKRTFVSGLDFLSPCSRWGPIRRSLKSLVPAAIVKLLYFIVLKLGISSY